MTVRKANNLINSFLGNGKTEKDFIALIHALTNNGLMLMDGEIDYNSDMTNKHYQYRVALETIDKYGQIVDGKTIGYLSAYKCFTHGLYEPYEILAYIS